MMDWTYDLFYEDAQQYKATPRKGVHPRANASDREYFMVELKGMARDFLNRWNEEEHYWTDEVGDAFAEFLRRGLFSDWYKDTYNQRPHLPMWYYVHALGLPSREDFARMFCAHPIEHAIEAAKDTRKMFEEYDRAHYTAEA